MNIELAEKVLAHIKEHREAFNMTYGVESGCGTHKIDSYPCGTVACIAGWTVLLNYGSSDRTQLNGFVEEIENHWGWFDLSDCAQDLLEISDLEANYLFMPIDDLGEEMNDGEAIARFEEFIKDKIKEGFKD